MQHCPVCLGRVSAELFNSHMSSHSKDEVVSALLRQPLPGAGLNFTTTPSLVQSSNPGSNLGSNPGPSSSSMPTTVTVSQRSNNASGTSGHPVAASQGIFEFLTAN